MRYYRARIRNKDSQLIMDQFVHRIEIKHNLEFYQKGRHNIRLDIRQWCNENIGTFIKQWAVSTSHRNKIIFYFKTKEDALAFKMCWST